MIPERNIKQARRSDNGELVQGYYCVRSFVFVGETIIQPVIQVKYDERCFINIKVDPATVGDVAVKPIFDGKLYACPNCGMVEFHNSRNKYCPDCGQKLKWQE